VVYVGSSDEEVMVQKKKETIYCARRAEGGDDNATCEAEETGEAHWAQTGSGGYEWLWWPWSDQEALARSSLDGTRADEGREKRVGMDT
jgi:hypothetical protein